MLSIIYQTYLKMSTLLQVSIKGGKSYIDRQDKIAFKTDSID